MDSGLVSAPLLRPRRRFAQENNTADVKIDMTDHFERGVYFSIDPGMGFQLGVMGEN